MTRPISISYSHLLSPPAGRFPMSHAPFVADLGGGRVGVVWFAGSREWAKDVHLLAAVYCADSGEWEPIRDFVSDIGFSLGNSLLLRHPGGDYHLWYVRTKGYWNEGEIVHMVRPTLDAGFSSKKVLPLGRGWLLRGRPIVRGEKIYLPVYHETSLVSAVWEQELSSEDGRLSETIGGTGGLIHPALVEADNDEFRCFMRNPWAPNRIHFAYSMDRGATWSRAFPTPLPNPNSGIDVARLDGDRLLCVYNDSQTRRSPLSVAVSQNGGVDWEKQGDLEAEPGEYSYPSLLATGEKLYLAYTHKREAIRFVALDPDGFGT